VEIINFAAAHGEVKWEEVSSGFTPSPPGSHSSRGLRLGIAEEFRGESMFFLPPFPGRDSRTEAPGCGKRREAALQNPDGPPTPHRND